MRIERRRRRSKLVETALGYWFSSTAARARVVGFVIADTAGLLVASNIAKPEAEELAAVAPLLLREDANGTTPAERHPMPISIESITIDGMPLLLCAVGTGDRCQQGLDLAKGGVKRILACHPS